MYRSVALSIALVGATIGGVFAVVAPAAAQEFPTRSIRMVLPFPAGGGSDLVARIIAQKYSQQLGQQVIVDNRAGAGGSAHGDKPVAGVFHRMEKFKGAGTGGARGPVAAVDRGADGPGVTDRDEEALGEGDGLERRTGAGLAPSFAVGGVAQETAGADGREDPVAVGDTP